MVIVIPFASCFRIHLLLQRTRFSVLIAATTQSSLNEASEIISPNVPESLAQVLALASVGLLALLAGVIAKARWLTTAITVRSGTRLLRRHRGPRKPAA
jgi:hypothetical protein